MNLNNVVIAGALVAILVGIVACFFGYRVYRVLFALLGFVVGAALGVALASILTMIPGQETVIRIILGLVGGLVGAALAWFLYVVFVFLSGAAIGAVLGSAVALAVHVDNTVQLILIVALAVIVGIIAVRLQKLFIILATALGGAQLIVSGASQLLSAGATDIVFNPLTLLQPRVGQAVPTMYLLLLVSWLVISIVGILVQYRIAARPANPGVKPTPELARDIQTGTEPSTV